MKPWNQLTEQEQHIIQHRGTERPFTGVFNHFEESGVYLCKRCNEALFLSSHKFASSCGWPAFDDAIKGAVKKIPDPDGMRTEIRCASCDAHLGHVFEGEGLTMKNRRHCVNSASLQFIPEADSTAYFGGGCFWGMEYLLRRKAGVLATEVGYAGGHLENPAYEDVCSGTTGHAEVVRVVFNPCVLSYEDLLVFYFEIHDPTQLNRQGPDVGKQYRSVVFYLQDAHRMKAFSVRNTLSQKGLSVVTEIISFDKFYPAASYHQSYYEKTGGAPYCHRYVKRF